MQTFIDHEEHQISDMLNVDAMWRYFSDDKEKVFERNLQNE